MKKKTDLKIAVPSFLLSIELDKQLLMIRLNTGEMANTAKKINKMSHC